MAESVTLTREGAVARVTLNRPRLRNALDRGAIALLTQIFEYLSHDEALRLVVLSGAGSAFCGGADINYMRSSLDWSAEENFEDAQRLSGMFRGIDRCAVPVIGQIHGAALGAGSGLAAVCDIVIAAEDALFGFTEVKLGIVPAVISQFVIAKIGETNARALFTTGERFDAYRAARIGLVHELTAPDALNGAAQKKIDEVMTAGPQATRVAKEIARTVGTLASGEATVWTARKIAERRASEEGQEGLRAFLEKRKPSWQ